MAVDQLYFRNRPATDVGDLQRSVFEYTQRLREYLRRHLLDDVVIGATETKVPHGQPFTPRGWQVFNQAGAGIIYQTRPADSRHLFLAALSTFGSAAGAPHELFVRNDKYYLAGCERPGGPGDDPAKTECAGTAAPTASFEKFVFAYPEVCRVSGTIANVGWYTDAGTQKAWVGIHSNTDDGAGNDFPAPTALGAFEFTMVGFLGAGFRSGAPTTPVALVAGQKFWVCTQINTNTGLRGYMPSSNFRPVLGFSTPAALAGTEKNFIGIRSSGAVTYAVGVFPAPGSSTLMAVGNEPIAAAFANTTLRPSCYLEWGVNSAAQVAAGGTITTGIEVW